jgi:hypothetical protein
MKTNRNLFICFGLCLSAGLMVNAQTTLTKSLQSFRSGDKLVKQQIEYKDPGRRGTDVLWDFSKLKSINEKYQVRYYTPAVKRGGDSVCITCLEHRTMYKYVSKGDSLLLMGFENSGSKLTLESPQYVMHFPFTLGDSITSVFKGAGSYEHTLTSGSEGSLQVVADALGTLILPDGDTLQDVLRVRSVHDYMQRTKPLVNERHRRMRIDRDSSIVADRTKGLETTADSTGSSTASAATEDDGLANLKNVLENATKGKKVRFTTGPDSTCYRTETCRWYAPGYRYPLFETIINRGRTSPQDTIETDDMATAFYFPSSMHAYLEEDPQNKAVLDSLELLRERLRTNPNDTLLFDYNLYPNPVRTDLSVELLLDLPSSVLLTVCTMSGEPVLRYDAGHHDAGQHTLTLSMSRLRQGYHVLHIQVNGQAVQVVLLKQ